MGFTVRDIKIANRRIKQIAFTWNLALTYRTVWKPFLGPILVEKHQHTREISTATASWVLYQYRRTPTVEQMFEDLLWQTMESRRRARMCTFYNYRFNQGLIQIRTSIGHRDVGRGKVTASPTPTPVTFPSANDVRTEVFLSLHSCRMKCFACKYCDGFDSRFIWFKIQFSV